MWNSRYIVGIVTGLVLLASPLRAQDLPVDLELVLAVDTSRSIDLHEAELQRQGYVSALTDPEVIRAIRSGILSRIAITYLEWSGLGRGDVIVDWALISDAATARAFADALARRPLASGRRTSISHAITTAMRLFDDNGFEGTRRVIDISGDGPNNQGVLVTAARDLAVADGVTINGLPIINDRPSPFGWPGLPDLDLYFVNCVIGGPASFIIVAEGFESFAAAIRSKLILEIARVPEAPSENREIAAPRFRLAAAGPPCDIGEQRWRNRNFLP